jgi:hypothetical protein
MWCSQRQTNLKRPTAKCAAIRQRALAKVTARKTLHVEIDMTDESDVMEVAHFIAELAKDVAVAHERAKLYASVYQSVLNTNNIHIGAGERAAAAAKQAIDAMEAAFAWVCPTCTEEESDVNHQAKAN